MPSICRAFRDALDRGKLGEVLIQFPNAQGQFHASLFPESAVRLMPRMKVRYVIVDPTLAELPTMAGRSKFDAIEKLAGSDSAQWYRTLWHEGGYRKPMFVCYADYYNTMGIRLFLNDGQAIHGSEPVVFRVQNDGSHNVITRAIRFPSAHAAGDLRPRTPATISSSVVITPW